jgi:hypothetical protein
MKIPQFKAACKYLSKPAGQVTLIDYPNEEVHIFIEGKQESYTYQAPFDGVEMFAAIGATDLDGNEIFEGDVLEFYDEDGKVLCTEEVPMGMRAHTIEDDPAESYRHKEDITTMSEYIYFICDGKPNARVIGHVTDTYGK